ncbi:MAG: hypothetical protein WDO71_21450 [Bacteroidota bacterium]
MKWNAAEVFTLPPDEAVKDGRIVTGKTWQSHPEFYKIVFNCLKETEKAIMPG